MSSEYIDTVVIGGSQAGLVVGYELKQRGREFVILDAHPRVGDAWRTRWDSLRLFTPRRDCALPGMRMSGSKHRMPSKDDMADYLESYAVHHELPIRTGVRVTRLSKRDGRFLVETDAGDLTAANVIVASGSYNVPKLPAFAADLDKHVVQLPSTQYRNAAQLQPGGVLVVGAANTGCDIALDVAQAHPTWLAGPVVKNVGPEIDKLIGRMVVARMVRFVLRDVMCLGNPIGRKVAPSFRGRTTPVVRVKPRWLEQAGVQRVGRVVGVHDGLPQLEDGRTVDVANVIWCTGFRHDYPWIELPGFDEHGEPIHDRGVSAEVPGLYFMGLQVQYAAASIGLWGMPRDAAYLAAHLAKHRAPQADAAYAAA